MSSDKTKRLGIRIDNPLALEESIEVSGELKRSKYQEDCKLGYFGTKQKNKPETPFEKLLHRLWR